MKIKIKRPRFMIKNSESKIETIKKCALKGIVSGDQFRDMLVLKGGNAIDLVHDLGNRASIDLDFSIQGDFDEVEVVALNLETNLIAMFKEMGLQVFDFKMEPKPTHISVEIADFWGGYKLSFKLIEANMFTNLGSDLDKLRRSAVNVTAA
ncbi:nucleotidyl transferase AbiEii/AbiGii toxin family protein [bacterium]|nr:nucleotidyl transferase AbiEii/AbiGii toxin family protein [bacterium]